MDLGYGMSPRYSVEMGNSFETRSGRHALRNRLEELGYHLGHCDVEAVYQRFLQLSDQKERLLTRIYMP